MVVGGGVVAHRRAASLIEAEAKVVIIAPTVIPEISNLPVQVEIRPYMKGDLAGAFMVVIATDKTDVNAQVSADAKANGVLVNRTDAPEDSDILRPAHASHGCVTIAVHTSNVSATAAAAIRRELSEALDPDWPHLLEIVEAFKGPIQEKFTDPKKRQERLRQLVSPAAMQFLKNDGEEALRKYCLGLL